MCSSFPTRPPSSALSLPGAAAELKLPLRPAPFGVLVTGIGGSADVSIAHVKTLTLAGYDIPGIQFLVGGSEGGQGMAGLLGQNVLGLADGDFDLANGVIRLLKPKDCSNVALDYWNKTGMAYSVTPLIGADAHWRFSNLTPSPAATAFLNGARIHVTFDTGAATSVLSLNAAVRAGVKPDSPGVVPAGY